MQKSRFRIKQKRMIKQSIVWCHMRDSQWISVLRRDKYWQFCENVQASWWNEKVWQENVKNKHIYSTITLVILAHKIFLPSALPRAAIRKWTTIIWSFKTLHISRLSFFWWQSLQTKYDYGWMYQIGQCTFLH